MIAFSSRWRTLMTTLSMLMVFSAVVASPFSYVSAQDAQRPRLTVEESNRFGLSAPLPRPEGTVRVATYNVLNLIGPQADASLAVHFSGGEFYTSHERALELARTIREMDADIIALQEVESYESLQWFRDNYLADMGYRYMASFDVGYYRAIEQSVLSRFPITNTRIWPNMSVRDVERPGLGWAPVPDDLDELTYQRSPLMVEIQVNEDYSLTLFNVHHKAGGQASMYHREAEAITLSGKVRQLMAAEPDRNIIVLGDFNAAPWDKSLRTYLEIGLIDTQAHRNTRDEEGALYKTHESNRVIDYILMNSAAHNELVIGSAHVFGRPAPPPQYDWRRDPYPHGYASDHYPVIIDIVPADR